MKLDVTAPKTVSLKIIGNHKIKLNRHKLKLDNSVELDEIVIDSIKCPHCNKTIYIIHDLNSNKPLPNHIYCPNCDSNIFSQILIAAKQKRRYRI